MLAGLPTESKLIDQCAPSCSSWSHSLPANAVLQPLLCTQGSECRSCCHSKSPGCCTDESHASWIDGQITKNGWWFMKPTMRASKVTLIHVHCSTLMQRANMIQQQITLRNYRGTPTKTECVPKNTLQFPMLSFYVGSGSKWPTSQIGCYPKSIVSVVCLVLHVGATHGEICGGPMVNKG